MTLPLAQPSAGPAPVSSVAEVLAILPTFLRPDDAAPVRDAILAGVTAMCLAVQDAGAYAAAQADELRATGVYQDEIGIERGVYRNGDDNETYRARQLLPPAIVTPTAILAAANALLKKYTAVTARYCESFGDRCILRFVSANPSATPRSYLYFRATAPRSPDYPDRFYVSEAAANGGVSIPGREPGFARLFQDRLSRLFVLRVPDLSSVDGQDTPVYQELQNNAFYVGTSAANSWTSYVLQYATTSSALYAAIVNVVERIKGHSMRWQLEVDVNLT
jgi:hypothetical protein